MAEETVDRLLASVGLNPAGAPVEAPDLKRSLEKLQAELAQWAVAPSTPAEIRAYDEGLQTAAVEKAQQFVQAEAFLAELEKRPALKEDLQIQAQMSAAVSFLTGIDSKPALTEYVRQARLFLELEKVNSFSLLREKLQELADKKLAFRARRDPRLTPPQGAVILRESAEEVFYAPHGGSLISQKMWNYVTTAFEQTKEASAERGKAIGQEREVFRKRATPGLTPYKAVNEGLDGSLLLPVTLKDEGLGRRRGEILVLINRGDFAVSETFGPDRIDFIKRDAVWPNSRKLRWFPLDPQKFKPDKSPWSIREIVFPALRDWYQNEERRAKSIEEDRALTNRSQEIQKKGDVSPTDILAGKPGFCGVFIRDARTNQYGPDDLTIGVRGTGNGTLILEEYVSRKGVFSFEDSLGKEIPLEEKQTTPENILLANQARIIRSFLKGVASRQRPAIPPQPEEGK